MKKCPKCKADIQDNAHFCVYCMTELDEKQTVSGDSSTRSRKPWWVILAAALLVVAIVVGILAFAPTFNGDGDRLQKDGSSLQSNTSLDGASQDEPYTSSEATASGDTSTESSDSSEEATESTGSVSSTAENSSPVQSGTSSKSNSSDQANSSGQSNSLDQISSSQTASSETSSTDEAEDELYKTMYTYRDAKLGDDFYVGADLENKIVITGVVSAAPDGQYRIPEEIGGKQVISVMPLAFSGDEIKDTVKKVILPKTVKNVWNNAFAGCADMTDIYFCSTAVYVETNAFADPSARNGTLTIHCSADCHDRNLRYYRNTASSYKAVYQEWNG